MSSRPHVFVDSYQDGIEKVRNSGGKYAFLIESTKNEYVNERRPCDTIKVGRNLDAKGYGIATPLNSPLTWVNVDNLKLLIFMEPIKEQPVIIWLYMLIWFFVSAQSVDLNLKILTLKELSELAKLENKWWFDRSECRSRDQKLAVSSKTKFGCWSFFSFSN